MSDFVDTKAPGTKPPTWVTFQPLLTMGDSLLGLWSNTRGCDCVVEGIPGGNELTDCACC